MTTEPLDYKIEKLTTEDKPLVYEFAKKFFFTTEPINEALSSAGKGILKTLTPEDSPMTYLAEGLCFKAVTSSGELIGVAMNAEFKLINQELGKDDNSHSKSEAYVTIENILNHVDQQITKVTRPLHETEKEMQIRAITIHDNWRNKGVGRTLLHESRKIALEKGFKQIRATCTNAYTAKMFLNCGFECVYALSYKDCKKEGKLMYLPRQPHTHVKGMLLKLKK